MSEVRFVDTTLRDGQQSLWAMGMRTGAMLSIAEQMDRVGFESMEVFVSIMIRNTCASTKRIRGCGCARVPSVSAEPDCAIMAECTAPALLKNCRTP
jgi:isopropylmalate/homocitrate/citramalate synthase